MLLNRVEKALMNNFVREGIQRRFEARRLLRMGGALDGGRALEIGCGRGAGIEIILDQFGAAQVDAFDLDPDMVRRAAERLRARGDRVRLWVGDATEIAAPDEAYDAVFDFGIVHHVPGWRSAVREIARVLKPGGRLYAEVVLAAFLRHPLWRRLLAHPRGDRFDASEFRDALTEAGLQVLATRELHDHAAWFVAVKAGPARPH